MTAKSMLWMAGAATALGLAACGEDLENAGLARPPAGVDQAFDGLPGDPALADLRAVEDPRAQLTGAEVRDPDGQPIGAVERVELADDGLVDALVIVLAGGELVRATPLEARYDEGVDTVELSVEIDDLDSVAG